MRGFSLKQPKRRQKNNLLNYNRRIEYETEILRLSRFAPYMVADEENRTSRFQQGLKMNIQMYLISQQLKIYSQVLTIEHEWGFGEETQEIITEKGKEEEVSTNG